MINMKKLFLGSFLIFVTWTLYALADEIDLEVQSGLMMKMLRDMANQTAADSLNLPANSSSIRPNITDTFSCENRTYGYYADVDNDCQIFHVCLTSQTATGRNVTYRWSFICPNETIFNQEVLVCTRPSESIDCKDSPDYYDVNMEIGKVPEKNRNTEDTEKNEDGIKDNMIEDLREVNKKTEQVFPSRNPPQKRKPTKQNYIVQQLIKDIVDEEMKEKLQSLDFNEHFEEVFPMVSDANENEPEGIKNRDRIVITDERVDGREDMERDERLILERSMGRRGRGSLRFHADV